MDTIETGASSVAFGIFELDYRSRELRKRDRRIRLQEQPFHVLRILIEHAGQVVSRETLREQLWPSNVLVDFDHGLNNAIARLREILGDSAESPRFIETLPRVGYRFIFPLPNKLDESQSETEAGPPSPTDPAAAEAQVDERQVNPSRRRWPIAVGLLIVLLTTVFFMRGFWLDRASVDPTPSAAANSIAAAPPNSVAVLPFANLTGDASKDYLGEGMAEELILTLAKVPGLKVPARTSSFSYAGRNTDIRQIAKDLGVGTVLEGSVRSAGNRLRISAELINARDGLHLWSQSYDEQFTDLFKLQDKLATAIMQALKINLNGAALESVAQTPPTQDVEAYNLYLLGEALVVRPTKENADRAIGYFKQALARDPKFARAYAGIATAYRMNAAIVGDSQPGLYANAERAARQGLALDPNNTEARLALAGASGGRGQWLEEAAQDRAIEQALNPDDGFVRSIVAGHMTAWGHVRAAVDEVDKAVALAPANPFIASAAAYYSSIDGLDADAIRYADIAVDLGYSKAAWPLWEVYARDALQAKRYPEAADTLIAGLKLESPDKGRAAQIIQLVYAALSDPSERATALASRARLYPPPNGSERTATTSETTACLAASFSYVLIAANDVAYDLANQCLDETGAAGWYPITALTLFSPELRPFRRDARFQAFATRLNFMPYWQQYGPPDDCDLKDGKLSCH